MAKKKWNKQSCGKECCDNKHCRSKKKDKCGKAVSAFLPGVVLNVKHLHLHFDEHMESTNFYHNGCCDCDEEDSVVVDMEELAEQVSVQTGVDMKTVRKVLAAETEIMEELGICETADLDHMETEDGEPEAPTDTSSQEESEE